MNTIPPMSQHMFSFSKRFLARFSGEMLESRTVSTVLYYLSDTRETVNHYCGDISCFITVCAIMFTPVKVSLSKTLNFYLLIDPSWA